MDRPMYTPVRIVKMNACRPETRISNAVNATSRAKGNAAPILKYTAAPKMEDERIAKVTRIKWPASMLANSRMASENGRTRKVEMNSMSTNSGRIGFGTSGGTTELLM